MSPIHTPPPIQLVAIDLDGTLLNDRKEVTDETVAALTTATRCGVTVVIASARPPRSVRPVYERLRLDTWQINYNGAMIWDEPSHTVVAHTPLDPAVVGTVIDLARGMHADVLVSCEILDRWHTDRFDPAFVTETARLFPPDVVAPLETFARQPVTKLLLQGGPDVIASLLPALAMTFGSSLSAISTEPDLIQINDPRASKGAALATVAAHYGVAMERVLAIGDALNDIPMLTAAGVGVAMDNAHPAVKAVAAWVAPSNNDHGVRAALMRYGLCG